MLLTVKSSSSSSISCSFRCVVEEEGKEKEEEEEREEEESLQADGRLGGWLCSLVPVCWKNRVMEGPSLYTPKHIDKRRARACMCVHACVRKSTEISRYPSRHTQSYLHIAMQFLYNRYELVSVQYTCMYHTCEHDRMTNKFEGVYIYMYHMRASGFVLHWVRWPVRSPLSLPSFFPSGSW